MKIIILIVLVLLLNVSLLDYTSGEYDAELEESILYNEELQQTGQSDKEAIANLVEIFGSKLKNVSLQAPKDVVEGAYKSNTVILYQNHFLQNGLMPL